MIEPNKVFPCPSCGAPVHEHEYVQALRDRADRERIARLDEREQLFKRLRKFEGFLSHHHDAAAAREHNVKELRALMAELREESP